MRILLLTIFLFLAGCDARTYERTETSYKCDKDKEIKGENNRKDFILQCIANANPKSDEEPEDWLYICENMSLKLFCDKQLTLITIEKPHFGPSRVISRKVL